MINTTKAMTASNLTIDFIFMTKLWATRAMFFKFDCDLREEIRRREKKEEEEKKEDKKGIPSLQMDQHLNKFHQNFHHQSDE
jgi:hypothetical protein